MGLLQDGVWVDKWYDTKKKGEFVREESQFHHRIEKKDGAQFPVETGRYHLYLSYACPWSARALMMHQLKGLSEHIGVTTVSPLMLENGWCFDDEHTDALYHHDYLYQLYLQAKPKYSGRVTVPVLWDKVNQTIVSNESAHMMEMFNHVFNEVTGNHLNYYPSESLTKEALALSNEIYKEVNNGVYRCGFATRQEAYEKAVDGLFGALDSLEKRLSAQPYLLGDHMSYLDFQLFVTLIRFDVVYFGHFKCNLKQLKDYPALSEFVYRLYEVPCIRKTVNFEHIKKHYYMSHRTINPNQIVPVGPILPDRLVRG